MNICVIGVPEGEERKKGSKKIFEEVIAEKSPNMGKDAHASHVQEEQSPRHDKPKEEHTKTHSNQIDKN